MRLPSLEQIPNILITLMIAFTVHEFAHAYVAYKFGDNTAKNQGRLTLNPLKHLDPLGTILIFIAGFGWARPVPVNRFFFKKPKLAGIMVSAAGPISNFLLAALGFVVWFGLIKADLITPYQEPFYSFFQTFIGLNVMLFIFNLLPFPPLDGYRIIEDLAPMNIRVRMTQYEQYGSFLFLVLVITPLGDYTIYPILYGVVPSVIDGMTQFFYSIFN